MTGNESFAGAKAHFNASEFYSLYEMLCPHFLSLSLLTIIIIVMHVGDSYSCAQSVLSWNGASFIDVS